MKILSLKKILQEIEGQSSGQPQNVNTPDQALRYYNKALQDMGIKVRSEIGSGTQGTAYATRDNKVLKITTDKSEANAAAYIKGKSLKNVYEVYEVFQMDHLGFYGILQERLKPASSDNLGLSLSEVRECLKPFAEVADGETPENAAIRVSDNIWQLYKNEADPDKYVKNAEKFVNDLYQACAGLKKMGIKFTDWHMGNVMKRGNDYVVIDLGYSYSPTQQIKVI